MVARPHRVCVSSACLYFYVSQFAPFILQLPLLLSLSCRKLILRHVPRRHLLGLDRCARLGSGLAGQKCTRNRKREREREKKERTTERDRDERCVRVCFSCSSHVCACSYMTLPFLTPHLPLLLPFLQEEPRPASRAPSAPTRTRQVRAARLSLGWANWARRERSIRRMRVWR